MKKLVFSFFCLFLSLLVCGPAAAVNFVIDDFNVTSDTALATSTGTQLWQYNQNGSGSTIMNLPNGGSVWNRNYYAQRTSGSSVSSYVSAIDGAWVFGVTVGSSGGAGLTWSDSAGTIDLSGYMNVYFDYVSDLVVPNVTIVFKDSTTSGSAVWNNLAATSGSLATVAPMALPGGLDYTKIVEIQLMLTGSSALDFMLDNVSLTGAPVPEPATMLLLASGLVGLAGLRRKFRK